MAKNQKALTPPQHEISAPKALAPLIQAFHVDSDEAARMLVEEAANAIIGKTDYGTKNIISKEELNGIISLMRSINPQDALESLYAAQIVACHMLGMRKLVENYPDDQKLGLNLLRFCQDAMRQLDRKRRGGIQNITVNYNYTGIGSALMQMAMPIEKRDICQSEE